MVLSALIILSSVLLPTVSAHHRAKNFELSSNTDRVIVAAGGTGTTLITVQTEGTDASPAGQVTLTLSWDDRAPQGISYSFTPKGMTVGGSSTLEFETLASSTIGTFHFNLRAWLGSEEETLRLSLEIVHPNRAGSFEIEASPLNLHSTQGNSVSSTVWVVRNHGHVGAVKLDLVWDASVPRNVTVEFTPNTVTPTAISNLTLKIGSNSSPGKYPFHIVGVSSKHIQQSSQMYLSVSPSETVTPSSGTEASLITLRLSEDNIILGSVVTITGFVKAGLNHSRVPVIIEYSNLGTTNWTELAAVQTDTTAAYGYQWSPSLPGRYQLKASWYGDAYHKMATSNLAALTVSESAGQTVQSAEFPWFWFALAAVGVIAALAAVMLGARRRAPTEGPLIQQAPKNVAPADLWTPTDPSTPAANTVPTTTVNNVPRRRTKKDPARTRKRRPQS